MRGTLECETGSWLARGTQNSLLTTRSLVTHNHQQNWFTTGTWDSKFISDNWVTGNIELSPKLIHS
jgi:hypothetical protein